MSADQQPRLVHGVKRFFLPSADRALVAAMESGLGDVERLLIAEASSTDAVADAAGRYLAQAGGKRVRPLFCLLASELGGGVDDGVVHGAVALELTHVASLYHDDVMDEADLRRGVPSANRVWGNNVAILAGDILFARASMLTAALGPDAVALQAKTFERLCMGQLHETVGPAEGEDAIEYYLSVLSDKTGSLIAAAGEFGLLLSHADRALIPPIRAFGESIGVAFQLVDDVIDLRSSPEVSGKTPGTDLREGVPTLPMLLLERNARTSSAAAEVAAEVKRLLADDATVQQALDLLAADNATAQALEQAQLWADRAVAALETVPDGSVKSALERLADYIVDRSH